MTGCKQQLASGAGVLSVSLKVAGTILLNQHFASWLSSATAGYLLVLPAAGIDVNVAVGMKHGLCLHLHLASQNLLYL
jgi:hypothetical protein